MTIIPRIKLLLAKLKPNLESLKQEKLSPQISQLIDQYLEKLSKAANLISKVPFEVVTIQQLLNAEADLKDVDIDCLKDSIRDYHE